MDTIFFRRLHVLASVGIHPHEKANLQKIILDLQFGINAVTAAQLDEVDHTIDYAAVREAAIELIQSQHFNLLETLAEKLAEHLLKLFPITRITLSISKPDIFNDMDEVGVIIERPLN